MAPLLVLLALIATPAHAQTRTHDPAGPWRTVDTGSYRFHYPIEAEPWALLAASQAEELHARVVAEVGYAPPQVVDVVVMDPFRMSNGFAIPFLWGPRMALFTTPPDATPAFGHFRSWAEELIVHEDAHLVHLLRPSRNPGIGALAETAGTTWLAANSPAWVVEGYATVVEGRLTGLGRPNSDFRALLLRKLSTEGRMPTYGQLDGSDRWLGGSFRYLVGSAYLEWLEARTHDGALRDLWARMSARELRTFDQAFEGVFGDDAATLYGRFVAEITLAAMEMERERPSDEGTLWLDLSRSAGAPAVSPDGKRLAIARYPRRGLPRLSVYSTEDDAEAAAKRQERIAEVLAADPEDVAPVPPKADPREPERERVHARRYPGDPRWTPDGRALLFPAWSQDEGGFLRPDLYRWEPVSGNETRVTTDADLVDADPHPDGKSAIAVRSYWGSQHLVRVDLATGEWANLTEPDPRTSLDDPRVSPDGTRVAYLRHEEGWHLFVRDLDTGVETPVVVPEGAHVSAPAWSPDGASIVASVGMGGFIDLWRLPLDGSGPIAVTHATGGAATPAPTPDGLAVYYLSADAEGLDVHRLALADALPAAPTPASARGPVVRPPPPEPVAVPDEVEVTSTRYGLGRWEASGLAGFSTGPGAASFEVGARLGDVLSRSELVVLGGIAVDGGWDGLSVAYGYRGLPVALTAHLYAVDAEGAVPSRRAGGALIGDFERRTGTTRWALTGGVQADVPWGPDTDPSRILGFLGADVAPRVDARTAWLGAGLGGRGRLGATGRTSWFAGEGQVRLGAGVGVLSVGVEATAGRTGAPSEIDRYRLGGTDTSLLPEVFLWSRSLVGGIATTAETGAAFTSERVHLGVDPIEFFLARDRLYTVCTDSVCGGGLQAVLAGAEVEGSLPPQGLARTPALHAFVGVACALQDVGKEVREGLPCVRFDDWRGWAGLTWRP